MRNTFINELCEAARNDGSIILLVGDLGYGVVEPFADEFPDRFINVGVAEQNMIGIAAGLASEGMKPFVYSIANFPTFRCAEQIRNDIAYHNLPVTIVSVGSGLSYGALGYSHHAVQDVGLIRSFPNFVIHTPSDPNEVKLSLHHIIKNSFPSYLRLGKAGEPIISNENIITEMSKPKLINSYNSNKDSLAIHILCPGSLLAMIMRIVETSKPPCSIDFFSCPIWSPADNSRMLDFLSLPNKLIVIEEHLLHCGFGSWILENLHESQLLMSKKIALLALKDSVCGEVANQEELIRFGGINHESIINTILSI